MNDGELKAILQNAKRIAVIGLSPVPARPSHGVTKFLIEHGYEIVGVRPAGPPMVLGRPCYETLSAVTEDIDLFDVFRNPEAVPGVVDEIVAWMKNRPARGTPRTLWLQEGVGHAEAEAVARKHGLNVVSDLCILKEYLRLL